MKLDTSVAPEIALLAASAGAAPGSVTIGYLAGCLRLLVADPERWWDLVRFDPRRPVRVPVTAAEPGCQAWLLVLPPGYRGDPGGPERGGEVTCLVAGSVTEQTSSAGGWRDSTLSAGRIRVRAGRGPYRLVNTGAGYAVTLHARPLADGLPPPGGAAW